MLIIPILLPIPILGVGLLVYWIWMAGRKPAPTPVRPAVVRRRGRGVPGSIKRRSR